MTNNRNHIENQPEFSPEITELISGTRIAWSKSKEEIWPELLAKMELKDKGKGRVRTISLKYVAVAAIIALLTGIPTVMYFYTKNIETLQAQQIVLSLPDNSLVKVSAHSRLSYKPLWWMFNRSVKLEGESYFEVQNGEEFEVISKKGKTIVLGTRFNVYARNSAYNVACTSGKVKVIESTYHNTVVITGGQKAILKADGQFEIINQTNNKTEDIGLKKAPDQFTEEELDEVLKPVSKQISSEQAEETWKASDKQIITKGEEKAIPDNKNAQDAIKEQSRIQNQAVEQVLNTDKDNVSQNEQDQKQVNKQNLEDSNTPVKDKFRASLTPGQLSILENKKMSREEKQKAFMQSLSREQKQLLKEQNEERIRQGEARKNEASESENMKDQQKMQMREQMRESGSGKMERQKEDRENKENARSGGGKEAGQGGAGDTRNQPGKGN